MGNRNLVLVLALLLELLMGTTTAGAGAGAGLKKHIVGDSIWSIPPTYDFYTNWSSSFSFHVGDALYFDFDSGLYNVIQVSRGEFDSCSSGNQLALMAFMDGPAVFPLSSKGVLYFICNVSNYCSLGQKVSVIVDHQNKSPSLHLHGFNSRSSGISSSHPSPSPLPQVDSRPHI